ncbi:hypothetical protein LCGC14_2969740 [marine sediment metagenome]|uniref:Core-binding (CB) domain-containing protein n=2 Tax=root TaxID=1 RepID=A0A7V1GDK5_9GAMM|nr:phage integrase N-terminal SAM-like domain-containing protein [Pseudoalteromonas prydzensis]HEA15758.1 hypothetical protein [Pseudoalteromonas prydzensis]
MAKGNKAKSYKSVLSTLNILMHDLPDKDVKQYTSELLESFLIARSKDRCWSAKTYRNQWQNLKSFFTWCSAKGYIKKNPVIDIPRPKLDKALPRFIENQDVKSILFSTDSYPWKYKLERSRNIAIISTLLFS